MSEGSVRHVAYEQVKLMLDFMGQHADFAAGQLRSLEARHVSRRLWTELAHTLNSCRGTRKTTDGWSKYWSDFKNKLKNKVRVINKRKRLGSTHEKGVRPLTKLEKRAVVILGPCFEKKVSRLALQDHQDETVVQKLPRMGADVKTETDDPPERDSRVTVSTDDTHTVIPPDVLESPSDEETSDFDDEPDAAEPLVSSLYPKWLIEIEQKRAEAELSRAAAARTQAEALKTLAEAARAQAEAVARIADVLDRMPGHTLNNIMGK